MGRRRGRLLMQPLTTTLTAATPTDEEREDESELAFTQVAQAQLREWSQGRRQRWLTNLESWNMENTEREG